MDTGCNKAEECNNSVNDAGNAISNMQSDEPLSKLGQQGIILFCYISNCMPCHREISVTMYKFTIKDWLQKIGGYNKSLRGCDGAKIENSSKGTT